VASLLAIKDTAPEIQSAELDVAYQEFKFYMTRWLPIVALTAGVSPLLGLLGTVTGMIKTFQLISLFGAGDAKLLSSGISEALITTEFGLVVAIPALLMHAYLQRRVKKILVGSAHLLEQVSRGVST
jgi:biopolymer transport protein ExbB